MTRPEVDEIEVTRGARTVIVAPELPLRDGGGSAARRDREARLEEAEGLALAIGLDILGRRALIVRKVHPATLLGKGQVDDIAGFIADERVELAVVDGALTPIQQRNLESAWGCKVIDRTALILEIFGERAATAEGRLQVELAHLDYQQGRLVRSWTHLERQRGGFGFLGGPGETQIEADRRMIRDRMARLRRQLEDVRRTRALHRQRRQRAPWPVVALVGYTNAGKSTLFNYLTASDVMAADLLFATLDPTMRQIEVPGAGKVILSDTVGFVSALPTQLVAAFRATLEEVKAADLVLHVRDIAHPDSEAQRADVIDVLTELGVLPGEQGSTPPDSMPTVIEIWNKIDRLDPAIKAEVLAKAERNGAIAVSAMSGEGMATLQERLAAALGGLEIARVIRLAVEDGYRQAWLHRHSRIETSETADDAITYHVRMSAADSARFDRLRAS
ncbi:MAG: GTPase HflX [Hyphomonas sp.]|nr:GTPase HflX [Hyphomonas sp.]